MDLISIVNKNSRLDALKTILKLIQQKCKASIRGVPAQGQLSKYHCNSAGYNLLTRFFVNFGNMNFRSVYFPLIIKIADEKLSVENKQKLHATAIFSGRSEVRQKRAFKPIKIQQLN